ncbi:VanZ family protein [Candidatus Pelagibacter communis]|uniref:VanZ family protein n=1 Tax=Pelagibacter ubique TaxID=198252 RepID=UPI00094CD94A|nr:VanZ family protein [Candidatus Pelagibacter ubique]
MRKIRKYLDLFFKISNFTIIILYLYPGSILGWIVHGNLKSQPQLTEDFLSLSSNHFYTFLSLSFIAVLSYSNDSKKLNYIFLYLFFISITLELAHIVIPNRSFQFEDLIGNITGVIISYILMKFYEFVRR